MGEAAGGGPAFAEAALQVAALGLGLEGFLSFLSLIQHVLFIRALVAARFPPSYSHRVLSQVGRGAGMLSAEGVAGTPPSWC